MYDACIFFLDIGNTIERLNYYIEQSNILIGSSNNNQTFYQSKDYGKSWNFITPNQIQNILLTSNTIYYAYFEIWNMLYSRIKDIFIEVRCPPYNELWQSNEFSIILIYLFNYN